MVGGLREYANNEGFYRQMHNAYSGDLLRGGSKSLRSKKRRASSDFYVVERVISKRKVQNTVGNINKVYLNLWIYAIACMHLTCSLVFSILILAVNCKTSPVIGVSIVSL